MSTDETTARPTGPGALSLLPRLRQYVLGDDCVPGTALSEVRLAEQFEVSRTPVREALKQLQVEGLVEIRPKVGTFVRRITRREIGEMFQVKEVLEGLAARLLAARGDVAELELLERNVGRAEKATAAGRHDEYAELVHEFHRVIVEGSDNHKLVEHYTSLMNQLSYHRMVLRSVRHPGRLNRSSGEHRRILDLIVEKDGIGAEYAMRDHVMASAREVMTDSAIT
ncbi:GntR family transcriptional regulator [Kineococcus gynurae]|uniref:GntR family transcriptional regulator n=1 Tax=Kineococcus gynurae TaxID=452979 RepID=A0ABV5LPD4_9ACTN